MHEVQLHTGQVLTEWPWVVTPDFINVIPVTADGRVHCFRQEKYAIHGWSYAPVGGYIAPDEDPLLAAQREMQEEMGLASQDWHFLGRYAADGNRGAGHGLLYLALDVVETTWKPSDDLERCDRMVMTLCELEDAILQGQFKLLPWTANAAMALLFLRRTRPDWFV